MMHPKNWGVCRCYYYIQERLTLDRIKFQSMNYTLKPEECSIDGNKVTIQFTTVAKVFLVTR